MNEQLTQIYGYLYGMWRYRWSALVIAWLVAILGWPIVFSLPDQFSAKTVVYVDTSSVLKPLLKGLALETDSHDELGVMSRVLLSQENLLSVARDADMDLEVDSQQERENMIAGLANSIVIKGGDSGKKRGRNNNMYEISYQSTSADRAYKVVSKLLNTMIENTLNSTRTDTLAAQKFLDTQIVEYEQRLSVAELQLAEFKKANVGLMPDEKGGYYMRLQRAQDAQDSTVSQLLLAERRYTELERQISGESPVLSSGSYQSSAELKIGQYQEQLGLLLNQYTEQHPDVLALKAIIEELKINRTTDSVNKGASASGISEFNPVYQQMKVELSKASVEIETLKIQLVEQKKNVSKLKSFVDVIPEVEAKLAKLNRGYEVMRERYLNLVERKESAQLAQKAGQSVSDVTFRVIEPPTVPLKPSGPKRKLLLAGVLLAALGSGLAWSFVRFLLQPTFFELRQLESITHLPVLGSVSLYLSPEHLKRRRLQLATFLSVTFLLVLFLGVALWYRHSATAFFGSMMARI